jgi:hypothetical protein
MATGSPSRPNGADDSGEVEIEVQQQREGYASQPPQPAIPPRPSKPRRAVNPDVDEVIHTGEIKIAPRSMVIRSSSDIAKIEIHDEDEQTLLTGPPRRQTRPSSLPSLPLAPARRSPLLWLAILVVPAIAGGAAFFLLSGRGPAASAHTPQTSARTVAGGGGGDESAARTALQATAQYLGTTIDGAAKATAMRAESIAMSPTLRSGIMTDAATVQDQARTGDTTYNLKPGEIVEVFATRNGKRTLWLRLPNNATSLPAPEAGKAKLEVRGTELFAIASAPIKEQSNAVAGELVLAIPIDLDSAKKRAAEHASRATLTGLGAPVVLVDGPAGTPISVPIETDIKAPLALEAVAR